MPFLEKIASGLGGARIQQAIAARDAAKYGGDTFRPTGTDGMILPSRLSAFDADEESSRVCGAEGCSSWLMPWKNRRRPIFEDEWGCSSKCMLKMVRSSVRRELTEGGSMDEATPHRHRVPLGLVLLAQGWITHPQLQNALDSQRSAGEGRIGDWLVQSGLEPERITRGLGVQWNCPVLSTEGFSATAMGLVMPKRFISEFGMLPLRVAGSSILYLAFEDHMDAVGALALEQMTGLKVESGLVSRNQFVDVRAKLLEADGVAVTMDVSPDADALAEKVAKLVELAQPLGSRLVRIHQYYWLRIWLESGSFSRTGNLPASPEDVQDYVFTIAGQR